MVLAPVPSSTQMVAHPVGSPHSSTRARSTPSASRRARAGAAKASAPTLPTIATCDPAAARRMGLVRALSPRGNHATVSEHGLASRGKPREVDGDVDVDRAEDDDHRKQECSRASLPEEPPPDDAPVRRCAAAAGRADRPDSARPAPPCSPMRGSPCDRNGILESGRAPTAPPPSRCPRPARGGASPARSTQPMETTGP